MRVLTIQGLEALQKAITVTGKRAYGLIRKGWQKEIYKNLRPSLRREIERAFGGKKTLARSYAIKVLGRIPYMEWYSHAPPTVPHEYGGTIRPKNSKYLAIPTGIGQKSRGGKGRQTGQGRRRTTRWGPRWFKNTFLIKGKGGSLIVMQRGSGKKGSLLSGSLNNVSPRGARLQRDEALPLFVYKRSVRLRKRTDVEGFAKRKLARISEVTANSLTEAWNNG